LHNNIRFNLQQVPALRKLLASTLLEIVSPLWQVPALCKLPYVTVIAPFASLPVVDYMLVHA
jgi:hypothetical protein